MSFDGLRGSAVIPGAHPLPEPKAILAVAAMTAFGLGVFAPQPAVSSCAALMPNPSLSMLHAQGPDPTHLQALMDFGRLVGVWKMEIETFALDGHVRQRLKGTWEFGWVLEGKAIQDVFVTQPAIADVKAGLEGSVGEYGTTLRMYDAEADDWQVTYFGPRHAVSAAFVARREESSMVLERKEPTGEITRWVFDKIGSRHFRWRALSSTDGRSWTLNETMYGTRVRGR